MRGGQEVPALSAVRHPGFEPTSGRPACITMHGDPAPRMRTSAAIRAVFRGHLRAGLIPRRWRSGHDRFPRGGHRCAPSAPADSRRESGGCDLASTATSGRLPCCSGAGQREIASTPGPCPRARAGGTRRSSDAWTRHRTHADLVADMLRDTLLAPAPDPHHVQIREPCLRHRNSLSRDDPPDDG